MGQAAASEENYRAAIQIDPNFAPALYNLAILRTVPSPAEAEELYRHVISLQPKDAAAHLNLGFLLRSEKRIAEGNAELNTAVSLDPSIASRIPPGTLATPAPATPKPSPTPDLLHGPAGCPDSHQGLACAPGQGSPGCGMEALGACRPCGHGCPLQSRGAARGDHAGAESQRRVPAHGDDAGGAPRHRPGQAAPRRLVSIPEPGFGSIPPLPEPSACHRRARVDDLRDGQRLLLEPVSPARAVAGQRVRGCAASWLGSLDRRHRGPRLTAPRQRRWIWLPGQQLHVEWVRSVDAAVGHVAPPPGMGSELACCQPWPELRTGRARHRPHHRLPFPDRIPGAAGPRPLGSQ